MRFFEDLEIGARNEVGSFTFTAEQIKRFAAQFDPQAFHLDEEAGRKSLFGGLAASGWHVGSVCMKLMVANGQRMTKEAAARGEKIAVWGRRRAFANCAGSSRCWPGTPSVSPVLSRRSGRRRSGRNGASCRPATPAPTSTASWSTHSWRQLSCRDGVRAETFEFVMAGLDPAIHDFLSAAVKTWMPGSSPGMTMLWRRHGYRIAPLIDWY